MLYAIKKNIFIGIVALVMFPSAFGFASEKEIFDTASDESLAAAACMAAYQDKYSQYIMNALEEDDWITEAKYHATDRADLRFITAKKTFPGETQPTYLIAVAGTQTFKDVVADLNMHKVPFAGKTLKEFDDNAKVTAVPPETPMVHLGFHGYAQTLLSTEIQPYADQPKITLGEWLLQDRNRHLLLAGHSLGGATVTLAAARLVAMGVNPSQINVITFGAPAIGNESFAEQFEAPLHLTRYVAHGDPIAETLQFFDHNYDHSHPAITLKVPAVINTHTHSILVYMDIAMKNYYDTRWAAQTASVITQFPDQKPDGSGRITTYVAPVEFSLPDKLNTETPYMEEALLDEYREFLPGYIFDRKHNTPQEPLREGLQKAAALNYEFYIVPRISATKLKNFDEVYTISLEHAVYRVSNGQLLNAGVYSTSTFTITPLEALLHAAKTMREESSVWLARK